MFPSCEGAAPPGAAAPLPSVLFLGKWGPEVPAGMPPAGTKLKGLPWNGPTLLNR